MEKSLLNENNCIRKKGFLDKLEMTKKNIFNIFVVRIKKCSIFAARKMMHP